MQHSSNRDLRRTCLCRHGPEHRDPDCRYAHSLSQLRGPDESVKSYADQWASGTMDRFYGQDMPRSQLNRIRRYYEQTHPCELPLWAVGLYLIASGKECDQGLAYSWDFGIVQDYDELLSRRYVREVPFRVWPGLWDRLAERRQRLLHYEYPCHELGLRAPDTIRTAVESPVGGGSSPIAADRGRLPDRRRSCARGAISSRSSSPIAVDRGGSPDRRRSRARVAPSSRWARPSCYVNCSDCSSYETASTSSASCEPRSSRRRRLCASEEDL